VQIAQTMKKRQRIKLKVQNSTDKSVRKIGEKLNLRDISQSYNDKKKYWNKILPFLKRRGKCTDMGYQKWYDHETIWTRYLSDIAWILKILEWLM